MTSLLARLGLLLGLLVGPPAAFALSSTCSIHFAGGQPPRLLNLKLGTDTYPLCFAGYATLFSGVTRTPLYSAEHLTADRVAAARVLIRVNPFHPESRLPAAPTIAALERRSGIDPFPALPAAAKSAAPDLTAPYLRKRGSRRRAED